MIRPAFISDAAAIGAIYNHYIANTCITFEEEAAPETEIERRIGEITASLPWLVWEEAGEVVGYAYARKWHERSAYRYSVESAVYLRHDMTGRGIGRKLYEALISELRKAGLHSIMGEIALPNEASQRLHEKTGFKKVAHFEQVGWKFGRWIDVGYWSSSFLRSPDPNADLLLRTTKISSNLGFQASRAMIHYNLWFSFRSHVEVDEGLAAIHAFLSELQVADGIAGFSLLKNGGNAAESRLLPFQALIEFCDDAQFSAAFSAQAARGIHTGLHGRVMSLVGEFQIEIFRQIATFNRPPATVQPGRRKEKSPENNRIEKY